MQVHVVCVCVRVCVCVCVRMYTHTHTHIHAHIHTPDNLEKGFNNIKYMLSYMTFYVYEHNNYYLIYVCVRTYDIVCTHTHDDLKEGFDVHVEQSDNVLSQA